MPFFLVYHRMTKVKSYPRWSPKLLAGMRFQQLYFDRYYHVDPLPVLLRLKRGTVQGINLNLFPFPETIDYRLINNDAGAKRYGPSFIMDQQFGQMFVQFIWFRRETQRVLRWFQGQLDVTTVGVPLFAGSARRYHQEDPETRNVSPWRDVEPYRIERIGNPENYVEYTVLMSDACAKFIDPSSD